MKTQAEKAEIEARLAAVPDERLVESLEDALDRALADVTNIQRLFGTAAEQRDRALARAEAAERDLERERQHDWEQRIIDAVTAGQRAESRAADLERRLRELLESLVFHEGHNLRCRWCNRQWYEALPSNHTSECPLRYGMNPGEG
jgi:hypothetical protein